MNTSRPFRNRLLPSLSRLASSLAVMLLATAGSSVPAMARSDTERFELSWAKVLEEHLETGVKNGVSLTLLDYSALAAGSRDFEETKAALALLDPRALTPDEAMATWMNAYNVLAVDKVLDNWPLESIRDAGGRLFDRVWTQPAGVVGGVTYSLDEIEHEILRPLGDPRIHAGIVCASVSCPDLFEVPFTANRLDDQLDQTWRRFLANPKKGLRIDGSTLYLSSIFDWFGEDFEEGGGILPFVHPYLPSGVSLPEDARIRFLPYDWELNGR